jgi:putative thioredoxin
MADVTDATFQTAVVERSKQVPVVVDLWAEWCGPCKQLGPILEKVIAETNGAVELAKIDVDANPAVGQAFKVQSIPAVYAMVDGQIVDSFMGAQGEAQVREFVEKLVPAQELSEIEQLIAAGDEVSLVAAVNLERDNAEAICALAEIFIQTDRADEATEILARIPESPETRRLAALARTGDDGGDIDATLAGLLPQVKVDEDARQKFVDLLELLGSADPRTADWRRRLSAALF